MKNLLISRSIRADVKPHFNFYSAPVGPVVAVSVEYKAGNGRNVKRGYYVCLTEKTIQADGIVSWFPFSAPSSSVLLLEAARYSAPVLSRFALLYDSVVPELAEAWRADRAAAEVLIAARAFEGVTL